MGRLQGRKIGGCCCTDAAAGGVTQIIEGIGTTPNPPAGTGVVAVDVNLIDGNGTTAGAGTGPGALQVDVIQVAGVGTLPGAASGAGALAVDLNIGSPMLSLDGDIVRIDNGNSKTLGAAPVQADIDTEVNTDFVVAKLAAGATTIPKPAVPLKNFEARKITFTITSRGTPTDTVTFTTGADGYVWATSLGPQQVDFDALVAAAPNNAVIEVGAKYSTALGKWMIVALAGYYA